MFTFAIDVGLVYRFVVGSRRRLAAMRSADPYRVSLVDSSPVLAFKAESRLGKSGS
jgi:hypothetical protein